MRKLILLLPFFLFSNLIINAQSYNGLIGACNDDNGQDIAVFPDGTKYILTKTNSYTHKGILITKIDSNNYEVWSKIYYGGEISSGYNIKKYKQKIIISGTTRRLISGIAEYRTLAMQIDTSGQLIWSNIYDNGIVYGMNIYNGQDIILTGAKYESSGFQRMFVMSVDSSGSVNWSRGFASLYNSKGQSIIQTSDSNILISGSLGYGSNSVGMDSKQPVLIKLDKGGNIIWITTVRLLISKNAVTT